MIDDGTVIIMSQGSNSLLFRDGELSRWCSSALEAGPGVVVSGSLGWGWRGGSVVVDATEEAAWSRWRFWWVPAAV